MNRPHRVWVAGIGSLVILDVVLDRRHDGSTLSEVTRTIYRVDRPAGRCAFVASWAALTGWFVPHILFPKT